MKIWEVYSILHYIRNYKKNKMILIYCCKYYEIILYDSSVILPKLNVSLTAL